MLKLGVIIGSIREGRVGLPIANWFVAHARADARFDVQVLDLKEINLPVFAERNHPRLQKYESEHQRAWSAAIAPLDAFVFITPEYNHSIAPAVINALDYLLVEWGYKPAAFVSYGGISGGLRAVQSAKLAMLALKIVPIVEAVTINFVAQAIDREAGTFKATEQHDKAALTVLNELHRWAEALQVLRK